MLVTIINYQISNYSVSIINSRVQNIFKMEAKKISFGFMKTKKQDKPVVVEKKEYIECVEEKSIKVVGGVVEEEKPLVIPMKPNTLITAEKLKEIAERAENFDDIDIKKEDENKKNIIPKNETLDQMAARELLEDAKKEIVVEAPKLVLPINAKPSFEGQSESTLDDYESVPIQEFGMAMLRGMGWIQGKESTYKQPQLRPKGLGLGADKVVTDKNKKKSADKEEELPIVKNSFVKITTGKHAGFYGKIVSLDEENGRVMVDLAIKKETVSLSEFMLQAVPKSEYDKESKVINQDTYAEYKKKENFVKASENKDRSSSSKNFHRQEESKSNEIDHYSNGSNRRSRSRSKESRRHRKDSTSSEEDRNRHRKKEKKKYSSNDSISSSDKDRSVSRRRHSSSDSSSSDYKRKYKKSKSKRSKEKRDIDKKRKGKKKKRDRDRSPHYKKHRK